jgi:hypothetical protein
VKAQRFNSSAMKLGPEFRVNVSTCSQECEQPSIIADQQGNFVIVWQNRYGGLGYERVVGRRFDPQGSPIGTEFQVNTYTTGAQVNAPAVAGQPNGTFVVVWENKYQDGDLYGIFGQRFHLQ